jgi:hypothetical protein
MKDIQKEREAEHVYQLLMGLNEAFSTIHTLIIVMDPLWGTSKVYSLVQQQEKHLGLRSTQTSEAIAFAAKEFNKGRNTTPHKAKTRATCDHCGKNRHLKAWCYEIVGYPVRHPKHSKANNQGNLTGDRRHNNNKQTQQSTTMMNLKNDSETSTAMPALTPQQYQQLMSLLNLEASKLVANFAGKASLPVQGSKNCGTWVIDSGASEHFTHNLSLLSILLYKSSKNWRVYFLLW